MTKSINDISKARLILEKCLFATDSNPEDLCLWEAKDLIDEIRDKMNSEDDFYIDSLPCGAVRIIGDGALDQIMQEELIERLKECYELSDLPDFVVIDWNQTAENCKGTDMSHHFAVYDGEEHNAQGFSIFRTN